MPSPRPYVLASAIALVSLTIGTGAHAAPGDATLAEGLFASGKEALAQGDLPRACARFAESLKLDPATGTLLNLATCEEKSGKLVAALEHFTTARGQLAKDDFRIKFTTEQIATLSRRVAHLKIVVPPAAEPPVRVVCDGAELPRATWNVSSVVDPGAHVIVVETAKEPPRRVELTLGEGEEQSLDAATAPRSATAAATLPSPAESGSGERGNGRKTLAIAIGSVGVAGLVTGIVTGVLAIDAASTYRDHCTNGICDPDGLSASSSGKTMSVLSPIGFAVGAVGLGLGTYLFLSTPKPRSPSTSTALLPTAAPTGGGLSFIRTF